MRAWATGIVGGSADFAVRRSCRQAQARRCCSSLRPAKFFTAEDVDDLWHPASLTKFMTAYIAFEAIKEGKLHLDDKIPCSLRRDAAAAEQGRA